MAPVATDQRRAGHHSTAVRLLAVIVLLHVAIGLNTARTVARHSGDFDRFWDIARQAGRPYRDYPVEYPIGTIAMFKLAGRLASNRDQFRNLLILTNVVADLTVVAAVSFGWGAEAALCYALMVTPILTLLFFRMDLWSVALTTAGVAAWQRHRLRAAALAFIAGIGLKLWPLPFAVLMLGGRRMRDRRAVAMLGVLGVLTIVCWWIVAGDAGFYQVLTFRAAHGWHIETVVGSLLRLRDPAGVRLESGALRIGSVGPAESVVMLAAGGLLSAAAMWTGARRDAIGVAWIAGIVSLLLLSPLLSPQFLGWMVPGAAVAWAQGHRRSAALVFAAVLMTTFYRVEMWPLAVIARNILLGVVVCSAAIDLHAARAAAPASSVALLRGRLQA